MSAEGENREKGSLRERRGRLAGRLLESAREAFLRGRTGDALALLERGAARGTARLSLCMEFLVPATSLAALYDRKDLADRWLERTARRVRRLEARSPPGSRDPSLPGLLRELDLLKLQVEFTDSGAMGLEARIEKAFSEVPSWKPWMLEFRWLFLLNLHRVDELEGLLSPPPGCSIRRGTLEYAARLEYLGLRFAMDLKIRPALILLQSAIRKLEECPTPEASYHKARTLFWMARLETEKGCFSRASELVREAEAIGRLLKLDRLSYLRAITRGHLFYRLGDYEKAARVFLDTGAPARPRSVYHLAHVAMALLHAAKCSIILGRLDQGRRLLARAASTIRGCPFGSLKGYLRLLQGDLHRERGTATGLRTARRCYRIAERLFRDHHSDQEWWMCQLHLSRGALHLKERKIAGVLHQASLGMELGRKKNSTQLQAEAILLRSYLLLEKEAPRADLYETILRQLGVVREPVVLFKILANLYIYSWDLGDQLELTDLHLKQIDRLRETIPARLYLKLYHTYLTERVLARFRARFGREGAGNKEAASG